MNYILSYDSYPRKFLHQTSALTVWSNLITQDSAIATIKKRGRYHNFLLLIKLLLTLPFSSATVERGFSTLSR